MSKIKSLVLGSAAAIVAIGGAQAADLPVKAKAVEYVKVCSLYGAGFYYIPGTDTCIRIGGYLRAEVTFNGTSTDDGYLNGGSNGNHSRFGNQYVSRARIMMNIDTRTATEYGVVRTFAAFGPQFTSNGLNGTNSTYPVSGRDTLGNGGMRVEAAFIQFAGFTFGRSASAYALPWNGAPGNINSALFGGPNFDAGVNNVQYTWQFGNGVSASIGVDESSDSNRTMLIQRTGTNLGVTATGGLSAPAVGSAGGIGGFNGTNWGYYAGTGTPDIVGNLRLDQAWGLLQFSAAAHNVNPGYYSTTEQVVNGAPGDKWGFAVTGALQIKNLPTGPGDDIKISGTYSEGALRYVFGRSGASYTNFSIVGGGGTSYAFASIADGIYNYQGGDVQLIKAYGFNGAFNHNWNQNWSSSIFGSWAHVDYGSTAGALYMASLPTTVALAPGAKPDFSATQLGVSTTWTPVKNLAFIAEATWMHLDSDLKGTIAKSAMGAPYGGMAGTAVLGGGQDVYSGVVRVQRNF